MQDSEEMLKIATEGTHLTKDSATSVPDPYGLGEAFCCLPSRDLLDLHCFAYFVERLSQVRYLASKFLEVSYWTNKRHSVSEVARK